MDGIDSVIKDDFIIIKVNTISDELKKIIKDELISICHGESASRSRLSIYSFKKTIKRLKNLHSENENINIGIMGELLLNIIIRIFKKDRKIVSPFFNMEQNSIKKGFDIIAVDNEKNLWIIESKAGELGNNFKNANAKVCERIRKAKNDLNDRLNSENSTLWLNAINNVKVCLDDRNEKEAIIKILDLCESNHTSSDINVILGGIVFCDFNTTIEENNIQDLFTRISNEKLFSKIFVIAIQKKTYIALYNCIIGLENSI